MASPSLAWQRTSLLFATFIAYFTFLNIAFCATLNVPGDYPDIKSAIQNASAGDTVVVEAGIYSGSNNINILIDKPLTVIGRGAIIQSSYSYGFIINASNVKIAGFKFEGKAVQVQNSDIQNLTISNITATRGNAVDLRGTVENLSIENCYFNLSNSDFGIYAYGNFTRVVVKNVTALDPYYDGIKLYIPSGSRAQNIVIDGVFISKASYGIYIYSLGNVSNVTVVNSTLTDITNGIYLFSIEGKIAVKNNKIYSARSYGVYVTGKSSPVLEFNNNSVDGAKTGVYLTGVRGSNIDIRNVRAEKAVYFNGDATNLSLSNLSATLGNAVELRGTFENLSIADSYFNLSNTGYGIYAYGNLSRVSIRNVTVIDPYYDGVDLFIPAGSRLENIDISGLFVTKASIGVSLSNSGNATDFIVVNSTISQSTSGIKLNLIGGNVTIANNRISSVSSYGIYVSGAEAELRMRNNTIEGADNTGVYLTGVSGSNIEIANVRARKGVYFSGTAMNLSISNLSATLGNAVELRGTFENLSIADSYFNLSNTGYGIYAYGNFTRVVVKNVTALDPYYDGIKFYIPSGSRAQNIVIDGVFVSRATSGVFAAGAENVSIANSVMTDCGTGINLQNTAGTVILENNTLTSASSYGIYLTGSGISTVKNNTVVGCNSGAYLNGLSKAEISHNSITKNTNYNLYLSNVANAIITLNTLTNSSKAVWLSSTPARVNYNNLLNSTYAIYNSQSIGINATYNYWGFCYSNSTLTAQEIDSLIYDDEESGYAAVEFSPWVCSPVNVTSASFSYPDLVVENISWLPAAFVTGDTITFTAIIKNIGNGSVSEYGKYIYFYIDGSFIGYAYTSSSLSPNETVEVSRSWTVIPGNHTVRAVVDATGVVSESNESNNALEVSLPYVEYPDLVVTRVSWSPANFSEGELVTFTVEVKNLGGAVAYAPKYVGFYIDGKFIGSAYNTTVLTHNQTFTVKKTWTATQGSHVLSVVADYIDGIPESNETNNAINITLPVVGKANLVVSSVSVPSNFGDGELVEIRANITNLAESTYRGFYVLFKIDGSTIATRYVSGLESNSTTQVVAYWQASPGNHTLDVVADAYNAIAESNESDNLFTMSLPEVEKADLLVVNLSWEPANFSEGELVLLKALIKNNGSATQRSFYTTLRAGNHTSRVRVDGIKAGELKNLSAYWIASSGQNTFEVSIDEENYIEEQNESNNLLAVRLPYVLMPDLTVLNISMPAIKDGDEVYFNITLSNLGPGNSSRRVVVRVEVDGACENRTCTFPCISSPDYTYIILPGLPAGENVTLRTLTPWRAYYGNHTITAWVDPDNTTSEANESNNLLSINISVPDLTPPYISNISIANGSILQAPSRITIELHDGYGSGVDLNRTTVELLSNGSLIPGALNLSDHTLVFTPASPLTDGNYTLVIRAYDNAGLINISTYTFEIDSTPPLISIFGVVNGTVYSSAVTPLIYISDKNLLSYEISLNGRSFTNGSTINEDGNYTLRITATDKAGNKAEKNISFSLDLAPLPPAGVVVQPLDSGVEITWQPNAESDILGYNIYMNGTKLNPEPVRIPYYRVENLSNATYIFQVTALDKAGHESAPATASEVLIELVELGVNNTLAEHFAERVKIKVENRDSKELNITSCILEVVNYAGAITQSIPCSGFTLKPNSERLISMYILTQDTSKLRVKLNLSGGAIERIFSVKLREVSPVELSVPLLTERYRDAFDIIFTNYGSAPLWIKGTEIVAELLNYNGEVLSTGRSEYSWIYIPPGGRQTLKAFINMPDSEKVHLENLSLRVRVPTYYGDTIPGQKGYTFVVVKNVSFRYLTRKPVEIYADSLKKGGTATVKVEFLNQGTEDLIVSTVGIYVQDENGSLYASGKSFPQTLVKAGESATIDVNVTLPLQLPEKVRVVAEVNTTYFTIDNSAEQLVFRGSIITPTTEPPYNANATTDKTSYNMSSPVIISGYALYTNGSVAPNVTLKITISGNGFRREARVLTSSNGSYSYTFIPAPTEAGRYIVSVTHPEVQVLESDAKFEILGLYISPLPGRQLEPFGPEIHLQMSKNSEIKAKIVVNNLGASNLTGIRIYVLDNNLSDNLSVIPEVTAFNLTPGESREVEIRVSAGVNSPDNASFKIYAVSSEGVYSEIPLNIRLYAAQPQITLEPWYIQMGIKPGSVRAEAIKIKNTGYATLRDVRIYPPATSWIRVLDTNFTHIEPGEEATVNLLIAPPATLTSGVYEDNITITSSNHKNITFQFRFFVTSALTGDLKIVVKNLVGDVLPGAEVSIIDEATYTQNFTALTDENGIAYFQGIPAGRYQYRVRIPHHSPVVGTVNVEPGEVREIEATALFSFLEVEWSVVPTRIKDVYEIVHNITYDTRAPIPYIKMDYTFDELYMAPGGVYYGNVTITNMNDIVSVFNVTPVAQVSSDLVTIEFGVDVIPELKPHESVTIPFVVKLATHHSPKVTACDTFTLQIGLKSEKVCLYSINGRNVYSYVPTDVLTLRIKVFCLDALKETAKCAVDLGTRCKGSEAITLAEQITSISTKNIQGFVGTLGPVGACLSQGYSCATSQYCNGWSIADCVVGLGTCALPCNSCVNALYYYAKCFFQEGCCAQPQKKEEKPLYIPPSVPQVVTTWGAPGLPPGGGDGLPVWRPSGYKVGECTTSPPTMCIKIKLEIRQELTLERQGFDAMLKLKNIRQDYDMNNISVRIIFRNSSGDEVNNLFFMRLSSIKGMENVDNGTLPPGGEAEIHWLIVPVPGAGGNSSAGVKYTAEAEINYTIKGKSFNLTTLPEEITVKPMPLLTLDYVLPYTVYGDNPMTQGVVEPPQPFVFGLRVKNQGYGTAYNLAIDSAQPRIVESYGGGNVDFRILGTYLNGKPVENSLKVNFGDLPPGACSTAGWRMTVSVTGNFTEYNATFKHSDTLGGEATSLIKDVKTHVLVKEFMNTLNDDGMFDFLIDNVSQRNESDGIPDYIIDSQCRDQPIYHVNATASYELTLPEMRIDILLNTTREDWVYFSIPDPEAGRYTIAKVVREDGKELHPLNFWQRDGKIHVVDHHTTKRYTVYYKVPPNISVIAIEPYSRSAKIIWKTQKPSYGEIKLGESPYQLNISFKDTRALTYHQVVVENLKPNTTYYLAINATDLTGISSELGGLSFTTALPAEPDFAPLAINVTPAMPVEGDTLNISVEIVNYGNLSITKPVNVTLSVNGTNYSKAISMNGISRALVNFSFTASAGNYSLVVVVDPENLINESNETNNVLMLQIHVNKADTTPPVIAFVSPTPANGSVQNFNYVFINITSSEALNSAWVEVWNSTFYFGNYSLNGSGANWYGNFTNLRDDTYYYRVWGNDSAGNLGSTQRRTVKIDTTPPSIRFIAPDSGAYVESPVVVKITADQILSKAVLEINGRNVTMSISATSALANLTLTEGYYEYRVYATDSYNNTAISPVRNFTVVRLANTSVTASLNANQSFRIDAGGDAVIEVNTSGNTTLNLSIYVSSGTPLAPERINSSTTSGRSEKDIKYLKIVSRTPVSNISRIKVEIHFTKAELGNIDPKTVELYYWNGSAWISTFAWKGRTIPDAVGGLHIYNYGRYYNGITGYVYAIVNHTSVFGIAGNIVRGQAGLSPAGGVYTPEAVLLANTIDLALAKELVAYFKGLGIRLYIVNASNFSEYSKKHYIIILGGQKAYEGVGKIVAGLLTEKEKETVLQGEIYIKKHSAFRTGDVVYIFAGKDRYATREAWKKVYKQIAKEIKYNWG